MSLALFCLALGALPLPGQVAAIAVYTSYQHPPSAAVVASLQSEVDSIIAPLGLDLEWRSLPGIERGEVSMELAVVTLKGTCDARESSPPSFRSGALGWTHVTDGEILPFMEVECDRIRSFLRGGLNGFDRSDRNLLLGRAVGRVIGHELYHILGRKAHHGTATVDRPAITPAELLSDDFQLEETECRILQLDGSRALPTLSAFNQVIGSAKKGQAKFVEKLCSVCHGSRGEGTRHGPALRGRSTSPVVLAAQLGIDSHAMCQRAGQLKILPPSLKPTDIPDLLRFLNAPVLKSP